MSAKGGRLEATITVPAGGWDINANNGGGAFTATVPAGDYFLSEFIDAVEQALDLGPGPSWTLTLRAGESASTDGKVQILAGAVGSITWVDLEVRDILGFTGNLSGATSYLSSVHPIGYWLPRCPKQTPYGDGVWETFSDLVQTKAPAGGGVKTLSGNAFEALEGVRWSHVANARAVGTSVIGSWQHFWKAVMLGTYSYIAPGKPVALYWDADANWFDAGSHETVYLVVPPSSSTPQAVEGWTGLYRVEIPMITRVT